MTEIMPKMCKNPFSPPVSAQHVGTSIDVHIYFFHVHCIASRVAYHFGLPWTHFAGMRHAYIIAKSKQLACPGITIYVQPFFSPVEVRNIQKEIGCFNNCY